MGPYPNSLQRLFAFVNGFILMTMKNFKAKIQRILAFFHLKKPVTKYSVKKIVWGCFIVVFFVFVFVFLLFQASKLASTHPPDQWEIGDWLINYQGGFIRRGLIGEIFLRVSQILKINIVLLVIVIQVFFYLIFLANACRLAVKSTFSPLNAALIFSPAFILFPVLDPQGGFRKEILLFALLATLCSYLATTEKKIAKGLPILIGLASAIIVLSHEILAVFLPYVLCAFIIYDKGLGVVSRKILLSLIPAIAIAFLLVLFSQGNEQVVINICNSLKTSAPADCFRSGAIFWIGQGMSFAHKYVLERIKENTLLLYVFLAFLAFLPLGILLFTSRFPRFFENKGMRLWLTICIASSIIGSLPLFWIGIDYGRFIYIHITCLSLLALMINRESSDIPQRPNFGQLIAWVLCLLFITGWCLMHYDASIKNAFPLLEYFVSFFRH